jgi:SAM-dependent methyltransferase
MSEFVFAEKDGALQFVGDFDALYRSERDPWFQGDDRGPMAAYYLASRRRIVRALFETRATPSGRGLEIGCGHGHAIRHLRCHSPVHRWTGIDISKVAIEQARELCRGVEFGVCDIRIEPPHFEPFDVVVMNQILWYVLTKIDATVHNAGRKLNTGGLFVVSQAFLTGEQRFGRDIADGFVGTLRLFLDRYKWLSLLFADYEDTSAHQHNDGVLVFRKIANAD